MKELDLVEAMKSSIAYLTRIEVELLVDNYN